MSIIQVLTNVFRVPELRRRLLFTLGMLAVYRLGSQIPAPGINLQHWQQFIEQHHDAMFGMLNLFSGGNITRMTVFALNITPYITASIMLQIASIAFPSLARLQKEGEMGRRKITRWTRYLTVGLALAQSIGVAGLISNSPGDLASFHGIGFYLLVMITLTTGTMFLMWLGEQITERGIGNGISLIIFASIVTGLPKAIGSMYINTFVTREWDVLQLIAVVAVMALVVAFVVLVERGERRIPVQYARRAGGKVTHLPMKVNAAGVVPVIFASAMLGLPQMATAFPALRPALGMIQHGEPLYYVSFTAAVMFFCFFYVSIIMNPAETADNLRRYGGFLPGIRPGRETAAELDSVLTRLTVIGALYLSILCMIPDLLFSGIKLQHLWLIGDWMDRVSPRWVLEGMNVNFQFGGTSLLIVVGVAMDLVNQIEAQLIMRHYETFSPRPVRRRAS